MPLFLRQVTPGWITHPWLGTQPSSHKIRVVPYLAQKITCQESNMLVPNALYVALGSTAHGDSFDHSFGFIMHGRFPFHWILSVQLYLITIITKMTHQTCLKRKTATIAWIPTDSWSHATQPCKVGEAELLEQPFTGLPSSRPSPFQSIAKHAISILKTLSIQRHDPRPPLQQPPFEAPS